MREISGASCHIAATPDISLGHMKQHSLCAQSHAQNFDNLQNKTLYYDQTDIIFTHTMRSVTNNTQIGPLELRSSNKRIIEMLVVL